LTLATLSSLSERFETPVILRLTTRICHVKGLVKRGERSERPAAGFHKDVGRWVMVPSAAKPPPAADVRARTPAARGSRGRRST
jgi:TPP-dependent indolepyruvate ferredoxin oxidoreductase alpha subunit